MDCYSHLVFNPQRSKICLKINWILGACYYTAFEQVFIFAGLLVDVSNKSDGHITGNITDNTTEFMYLLQLEYTQLINTDIK